MTLRTRLALTMAVLAAFAATLVAAAGYRLTAQRLNGEVRESIEVYASRIASPDGRYAALSCGLATRGGPERSTEDRTRPPARGIGDPGLRGLLVQCADVGGVVVRAASSAIPIDDVDRRMANAGTPSVRTRISGTDDDDRLRITTVAVPGVGIVQIARSLAENDRVLGSLIFRYCLLALLVTALAALAGWALARHITHPIMGLTTAAEAVAATGRLDFDGTADTGWATRARPSVLVNQAAVRAPRDETKRLGAAFSTMLDALQSSREQQARLVQDAGHELRTPLTSLRTNVATLRRHPELSDEKRVTILDDLHVELRELTTLTNELVELAGNSNVAEPAVLCDLGELASRAVERARRRTGRAVATAPLVGAPVSVPPSLVLRAIDNLLVNAAKFTPAGTPIELAVASEKDAVVLVVRDHGPGIAEEDLPRIFDRFYRADSARSHPGSGLGLSIVQDIVTAQGGTVSAMNHPLGGAEFIIRLPRAAASE